MSIEAVVAGVDDAVCEPLVHLVGFGVVLESVLEGWWRMPI